jgi:hypothetical protein
MQPRRFVRNWRYTAVLAAAGQTSSWSRAREVMLLLQSHTLDRDYQGWCCCWFLSRAYQIRRASSGYWRLCAGLRGPLKLRLILYNPPKNSTQQFLLGRRFKSLVMSYVTEILPILFNRILISPFVKRRHCH